VTKPNAENERQKRAYFSYLRDAHGRDDATIDRVAASLARFEASTRGRDFRRFHREQAVAFKAKLSEAVNARTGERLSKATVHSTLRDLRSFFLWLAQEPGYRSKIAFADADYSIYRTRTSRLPARFASRTRQLWIKCDSCWRQCQRPASSNDATRH
jgi:site-specific recombinase XerD